VSQIDPGTNDRRSFDPAKLAELAESIRQNGLAQPITVRPLAGRFQIVAGERRFRAVRDLLGWPTIPAIVRVLDDATASAIMLAENLNRVDLNPIEEAQAFDVRIRHLGWTEQQVADAVGISLEIVRRRLSLLALVPDAQFLVAKGHLPIGHAECLVRLDVNRQRIALRTLNDSARLPTLAVWRSFISQLLEEQAQDAMFDLAAFFTEAFAQPEDLPRRGKRAVVGAPVRHDLPPITVKPTDSTADILDRWIAALLSAGHAVDAATVGTLYTTLVHANFMTVPCSATLLSQETESA
jgi:ParB/RepB/Spo0J family partition protein